MGDSGTETGAMDEAGARPLRALGDPVRCAILAHIAAAGGAVSAGELAEVVSVRQPTLSYHLAVLREAGLLRGRKEGRQHFHEVRAEGVDALATLMETDLLADAGPAGRATA